MPDWRAYVRDHLRFRNLDPALEIELSEEIAAQLEESYLAAVARGLAPAEAFAAAAAEIPNWDQFACEIESCGRLRPKLPVRRVPSFEVSMSTDRRRSMLGDFMDDLKFGWRGLRKNRAFAAVAILTLALGIGLNSAIFSLVNAVLFRPMPVLAPEELVGVYNKANNEFLSHVPIAYPDFLEFAQNKSLNGLTAYALSPFALDQGRESQFVMGEIVTGNYFTVLGVNPVRGRTFSPEEDRTVGTHAVLVLSHAAWQQRFGSDPQIVGRTLRLNGNAFTVIGVMGPEFQGMTRGISSELWVPMMMFPSLHPDVVLNAGSARNADRLHDRNSRWLWSVGRLKPGVTLAQAQAELQTIAARLQKEYPESNKEREVGLLRTNDVKIFPGLEKILYAASFVLMTVVGLILLIASANVANMLVVRAIGRRKEIAVRISLGASRGRLVRQLLAESLLLSAAAGALALVLARWSNALVGAFSVPSSLPFRLALGLTLDLRVFLFTLTVTTLTTVLFGLIPALQASKSDVVTALKEESRSGSGGAARMRLRNALVVVQVALSVLILIGAGLSVRSMLNAHRTDPGFDPGGLAVIQTAPSLRGYSRLQSEDFYRRLLAHVRGLPGVESAGLASSLPLSFEIHIESGIPEEQRSLPPAQWPDIDTTSVGPGYFAAMRIAVLRGRDFSEQDSQDAPRRAVVNEALARSFWPGQDPIGRQLILGQREKKSYDVVGVVRNGKYRTLGESPRPFLYASLQQSFEADRSLVVRSSADPSSLLPALRDEVRQLDDRVPVSQLGTVTELISGSVLLPRLAATLFGLFGALGLLLASVGLYGVVAYTVTQRTREIGIRVALGAGKQDVLRLVVGGSMRLVALGVAVGLAAALGLTRVIGAILYGISPTDSLTFIGISLLLLLVTLLACLGPARRALRVDPMDALRYE